MARGLNRGADNAAKEGLKRQLKEIDAYLKERKEAQTFSKRALVWAMTTLERYEEFVVDQRGADRAEADHRPPLGEAAQPEE